MTVWEWFLDPGNWTGPGGVLARTREQLVITAIAVGSACLIALPLGIATGHARRFGSLVTNVANLGRAIPTFGLLLLFASISAIGVGPLAAILALILFAIPPIVTNAHVALTSIEPRVRQAGIAMGMNGRQLLAQVELPLASPLIFAGVRTALVQTTATATLAAFVGGGGLGRFILDGFGRQDSTLVFAGVICVAVLTVTMELLLALAQRAVDHSGRRRGGSIPARVEI